MAENLDRYQPTISVVMPVYNGEQFLAESIESILNQTYPDFEFIIIDDGSTDRSLQIIERYAANDKRVRLISRTNRGLVATLNEGITKSQGLYIARQDADDISLPERFEKQIEFLNTHPDIEFLGTDYFFMDEKGGVSRKTDILTRSNDIKLAEIFSNQFGHGTVMISTALIKKHRLFYDADYKHAEDYELWTRICRLTRVANISSPLYKWRQHSQGVSAEHETAMHDQTNRIRDREFQLFHEHRNQYRLFSLHPFSISASPKRYFEKKNTLYRDMAISYSRLGYRRWAAISLLMAIAVAPWVKKSYRYLYIIVFRKQMIAALLDYEYI
jgi:glycosyltransferase involved in cell wall biosynthesis